MEKLLLKLLNINDDNIIVNEIHVVNTEKAILLSTHPTDNFCDICGSKLHSKGVERRILKHPILQDGYTLKVFYDQRRYKCKSCNHHQNEVVSFAVKNKQSSKFTYINICNAFKSLTTSVSDISNRFNISTTTARRIFLENVSVERLRLPEVLCIDEVHLNLHDEHKYPIVLLDFNTNEPIDLIISRREKFTIDYFSNIPLEERRNVKVIICDMYKPYIRIKERYFPRAILVVDSFHVISHLNKELRHYLVKLKKRYQEKDKERLVNLNERTNGAYNTIQSSLEVYLLQKYTWIFLKKESNLCLNKKVKYNSWFCGKWTQLKLRDEFFKLDNELLTMYRLKEMYYIFNTNIYSSRVDCSNELTKVINVYKNSNIKIFIDFSRMLTTHFEYIINSFETISLVNNTRRLSNGPIEGFNRKIKDLKRNSRGVSNFEFTRARIIWATRKNCPFKG